MVVLGTFSAGSRCFGETFIEGHKNSNEPLFVPDIQWEAPHQERGEQYV